VGASGRYLVFYLHSNDDPQEGKTMNRKHLVAQIGLILGAMSAGVLVAQEQPSGPVIEEVVVTAQKRAESSQDVPIAVQAFSADSIEKLGATQVQDLSKSAPSLSVGGIPGSNSTMGLRGVVDFSRNIGIDARMGVYIDGVYQGRSSSANQPLLGLESVEILRGPQGTLFGKNTVSGAINLNTRKASDEFSGELAAGAGNEGYWTGSAYLNGPLTDTLFGSIGYSRQERDGYFNNQFLGEDTGDWKQQGSRGQLRWLPTEALEVIFAGDYGKNDSEMPIYARNGDKPYTVNKSAEKDEVEFWGSALTLNYSTASDYTLTSITAYRHNEYEAFADEDFSPIFGMHSSFDEESSQFSQELRIVSPQQDRYDWVAGLYYFDTANDDISTGRNIDFGPLLIGSLVPPPLKPSANALAGNIAIPSELSIESFAAYLHGNYRFTEALELTAGLRFTREDKDIDFNQINAPNDPATAALLEQVLGPVTGIKFSQSPGALFSAPDLTYKASDSDNDVSPTIGLNYTLADDVMVYAKYSRGYKSGGWNADFRTSGLSTIAYDPESVDAWEIGLKSTLLDGTLRLNADVFVQKYDDFQVFQRINVNNTSVQELTNAGEATSQGFELETIWLPTDRLQLTLNATYLDATYDSFPNPAPAPGQPTDYDGNDLAWAPEWKVYAGVQFVQPLADLGDLTLNVDYSYQDESYSDPQNRELDFIPDYDVWNARATFNPASDRWQLAAWVRNIADDDYITNHSESSLLRVDRVIWGEPRMYGATFTWYLGN
jgi:iron complex outermembrane receptor protein